MAMNPLSELEIDLLMNFFKVILSPRHNTVWYMSPNSLYAG